MKGLAVVFVVIALFILTAMGTRSYYSHNHPILHKVRENFGKLDAEYAKIPLREGDSAYTENKEVITLCLKDPETGAYYDMNTIMYVSLHELAHVISKTLGHNEEFKRNFSALLHAAALKGIYDPRKSIPETYCGIGPHD